MMLVFPAQVKPAAACTLNLTFFENDNIIANERIIMFPMKLASIS
jgi:hypothetical protein